MARGPCTRIGPFSTSITAARSASPIVGRPKCISRIAFVPLSLLRVCDFDDGALSRRLVDGEADRHRGEDVLLTDFRLAAAEDRVDEGRDEIALLGSRIG